MFQILTSSPLRRPINSKLSKRKYKQRKGKKETKVHKQKDGDHQEQFLPVAFLPSFLVSAPNLFLRQLNFPNLDASIMTGGDNCRRIEPRDSRHLTLWMCLCTEKERVSQWEKEKKYQGNQSENNKLTLEIVVLCWLFHIPHDDARVKTARGEQLWIRRPRETIDARGMEAPFQVVGRL